MSMTQEQQAALYAQQDDMMEWGAVHNAPRLKLVDSDPLDLAPGVIDGPYTHDAQEHHDWEDAEAARLAGTANIDRVVWLARAGVVLCCASFAAGLVWGIFDALPAGSLEHIVHVMGLAR